jgi:hypothetical protein
MQLKDVRRPAVGPALPLVTGIGDTNDTRGSPTVTSAEPSAVDLDNTARNEERPPRLRLASAVMFVQELGRSVSFYRDLLAMDVRLRDDTAALLVSPGSSCTCAAWGREPTTRSAMWASSTSSGPLTARMTSAAVSGCWRDPGTSPARQSTGSPWLKDAALMMCPSW